MFSENYEIVKLIDLGVAMKILPNSRKQKYQHKGTPRYSSPEQFNLTLAFASDIWSFGCVLVELVTGTEPFGKVNNIACISRIRNGENPL